MGILSVENVTKKIKGHTILNKINLHIEQPGIYGIVGRNGSGKSILFKTIAGLMLATSGTVQVFDEKVGKNAFPKHFGALLDQGGFLPTYSSFKNLKYLASIQNKIDDARILEVIELVGLDPTDPRPISKYSLGMKQRLGIAQAIMEKPKLLLLDEPMNGLDEDGVKDMRILFQKLSDEGVTILLSSHNAEDIKQLCSVVYHMNNGELSLLQENKEYVLR